MADIPHEAPHETAQKAASGISGFAKKIPPSAWVVILGLLVLGIVVLRRRSAAAAKTAAAAPSPSDPNAPNPNDYSAGNSGLDQAYLSGYDSGIYSTAGGSGFLAGAQGVDSTDLQSVYDSFGKSLGTALAAGLAPTLKKVPTGGGAPKRPKDVHSSTGILSAPSGSHKPKPPQGYKTVSAGHNKWNFVPLHKTHK